MTFSEHMQKTRLGKNFIIIFFLPILLITPVLITTYKSPLVLIPNVSKKFQPYCDQSEKGNSEVNYYKQDSNIIFAYTLKRGFPYPYAGLVLTPDSHSFFDMSKFNKLSIRLKTSNSISIRLFIHTLQDSVTKPGNVLSERYNGIQIPTGAAEQTYLFALSDFITPEWWYERNGLFPQKLKPADYTRVTAVDFNNGLSPKLDQCDTITLTEMKFFRDNRQIYIFIVLFTVLYYVILILLITVVKLRTQKLTNSRPVEVIPYQKLEINSASVEECNKVVSFLGQNFSDPDISVKKVAHSTGLSEYKVPSIIKKKFNCSFKEYLNKIRIEEAKRLLSTTDRQITEIIFAVGYNSPPHFNHLFKEITGKTPREFRDAEKPNT